MTAAVVPVAMPLQVVQSTAEARKRRREILASQRCAEATLKVIEPMISMPSICEDSAKRCKLDLMEASMKSKKPQMKYDPEVPMTKEEAAVWRREQRRKRNRESAAASRQRQRDRIVELEIELDEWKDKFDSIMQKIKDLEELSGKSADDYMSAEQSQIFLELSTSKFVSPPTSPGHSSFSSDESEPSPVASSSLKLLQPVKVTPTEGLAKQLIGQVEHEHSIKMISRQAVKISDAPSLPLLTDSDEPVLTPEVILSATPMVKLDPIDSSLFSVKEEEKLPALLSDEEKEDEFGEFLLDAVQWL
eukprot:CAMPEP_0170304264 /NCGR_PEP_ID=MMETSP0116_2-20130129/52474_1 /TAXON_ID=400756 /ORGANISM="Durinskia baltica, Strain CSIRO CS-38" /LENGTH=303 /DNA_ID=CAMNT_0010556251 /DNA_START=54 /DNA_END=965 /DNA_ORIENTATION=-